MMLRAVKAFESKWYKYPKHKFCDETIEIFQ